MIKYSAVYWGSVRHRRFVPKEHKFHYKLVQWSLALDELSEVNTLTKWLSTTEKWAPLHFNPTDYLPGFYQPENETLAAAVLRKMNALAAKPLHGRTYFLGNIRTWGLFFSPLNCYFLQNEHGSFTHMLAEVSNTPWNKRHYYLVCLTDLDEQGHIYNSKKNFHVSPFNPMDMEYEWRIRGPEKHALVHIGAHREQLEFDATMTLTRSPLNRSEVFRVLRKHPVMTLKMVAGIYWQALLLFIKKVPFYGHRENRDDV